LRQVKDGRGWPTVGNIVREGPDGRPERVFMQEELFGPEEYRQVVAYHYGMARHHLFKAQTYHDHAKARYGVQLPLFDEVDGGTVRPDGPTLVSSDPCGKDMSRDVSHRKGWG
jgi:hypothetical protein